MTTRRRTLRSFFTAILAPAILLLLAGAASALDNGQCLDCHGDRGILGWSPEEKASNVTPGGPKAAPHVCGKFPGMSLHVDPGALQAVRARGRLLHRLPRGRQGRAAHRAAQAGRLLRLPLRGGRGLREEPPRRHLRPEAVANAPACVDCHGAHAVPKSSVSTSPVYFRNIAATCTRCHGDKTITDEAEHRHPGSGEACTSRASTTGPSSTRG